MQLQLPIFPEGTHMISDRLGFYVKDNIVQYIINGLPAYAHSKSDHSSFRFITSNFIDMGLCTQAEVQRAFHVSITNVGRAYKLFKAKGSEGFFGADKRHGNAHKILGERKERIQKKLDEGKSISSIAREEGIAEGGIRYHIKQGSLKKTPNQSRQL
jgi:DNA-binding NarL/FixJ family response regulator